MAVSSLLTSKEGAGLRAQIVRQTFERHGKPGCSASPSESPTLWSSAGSRSRALACGNFVDVDALLLPNLIQRSAGRHAPADGRNYIFGRDSLRSPSVKPCCQQGQAPEALLRAGCLRIQECGIARSLETL